MFLYTWWRQRKREKRWTDCQRWTHARVSHRENWHRKSMGDTDTHGRGLSDNERRSSTVWCSKFHIWIKTTQTHLQTDGQRLSECQSCLNSVKHKDNQRQRQISNSPRETVENDWTDKDSISVSAETSMLGCAGRCSCLCWTSCDVPSLSWTPQGSWERHWAAFPTSGPGLGTLKGADTHDQIFLFLTETSALAQLCWLDLDIYNLLWSD